MAVVFRALGGLTINKLFAVFFGTNGITLLSHFQNLTSFGVGYFTINPFIKDGFYDLKFLEQQEVYYEDDFIRHIRFEQSLNIIIDGRKNRGMILKPGEEVPMLKKGK